MRALRTGLLALGLILASPAHAGSGIFSGAAAPFDGNLSANLIPGANLTYDIGSSSKAWSNIYVANMIAAGSGRLTLTSNLVAGSTSTDFLLNTATTRSAGLIFDIQKNGTTELNVNTGGTLTIRGNLLPIGDATQNLGALGTRWDNLYLGTAISDAGANRYSVLSTTVTRMSSSAANAVFAFEDVGNAWLNLGATSTRTIVTAATQTANSGFVLQGNKAAADTGTDIILRSGSGINRSAGLLLDVQEDTTTRFSVDTAGVATSAAGFVTAVADAAYKMVEGASLYGKADNSKYIQYNGGVWRIGGAPIQSDTGGVLLSAASTAMTYHSCSAATAFNAGAVTAGCECSAEIDVTGAAFGDASSIGLSADTAVDATSWYYGKVSSAGKMKACFCSFGAAENPASVNVTLCVTRG